MKVVNEKQDQFLENIQNELTTLHQSHPASPEVQETLNYIYHTISRRLRQFQSSQIIIICVGMLKAGKSTLVNLLARTKDASPVGYGVDTTLRPALIKAGQQGSIDIYYASSPEKRQDELHMVLDNLRGLEFHNMSRSVVSLKKTI